MFTDRIDGPRHCGENIVALKKVVDHGAVVVVVVGVRCDGVVSGVSVGSLVVATGVAPGELLLVWLVVVLSPLWLSGLS